MTLAEKLLALHAGFAARDIPHAFGGAIALAYWTLDPRGTSDLDVNLFLPVADCRLALSALPPQVDGAAEAEASIVSDGQVRLWWDQTPLDLFFDYEPIHAQAARHSRIVPFEGEQIPVLGPVELAVFKAVFDRTKDWADIEAMLAAGSVGAHQIRSALAPLLGRGDPRLERLDEAERRARA